LLLKTLTAKDAECAKTNRVGSGLLCEFCALCG
jgi:hypothetical protein